MYLIYDIHLVLSSLGWNPHLVRKVSYIIYRIVGGGIKLKNIESKIFICMFGTVLIYFLCQDSGTCGLSHTSWTTKKKGLGQMVVLYGIEQGVCNSLLPHNILERLGSIFSGRYYKWFHKYDLLCSMGKAHCCVLQI